MSSSQSLSQEQLRNLKVLEAVNAKGKVSLSDLALGLNTKPDQNLHGRKLRLVLADLVYSKSLKVSSGRNPVYSITTVGKVFVKELSRRTEVKPAPKGQLEFDLAKELRDAAASPKPVKPSLFGTGKKVAQIQKKESKIIPLTREAPEIAPYPIIGNLAEKPRVSPAPLPVSEQPQKDAFKIFEEAFAKDPNKTLDTLVKVVFEQQRKLERQEKLIRGLHKLLGDYLAG